MSICLAYHNTRARDQAQVIESRRMLDHDRSASVDGIACSEDNSTPRESARHAIGAAKHRSRSESQAENKIARRKQSRAVRCERETG